MVKMITSKFPGETYPGHVSAQICCVHTNKDRALKITTFVHLATRTPTLEKILI